MRYLKATLLLVTLLTFRCSLTGMAQEETLTNASIVKMVQAHLGTNVILGQIRNNPGNYVLTVNSLITLKQQGVSEQVISEMQAKQASESNAGTPATKLKSTTGSVTEKRPPIQSGPDEWHEARWTDPMTDKPEVTVVANNVGGTNGGVFDVEAFCEDETGLSIRISNADATRSTFKRLQMAQSMSTTVNDHGIFGVSSNSTVSAPNSCVQMDVRVGGSEVKQVTSSFCNSENRAALYFGGEISQKRVADLSRQNPSVAAGATFMSFLGFDGNAIMTAVSNMAVSSEFRMSEVINAGVLRVQIPFTDDRQSMLILHPQHLAFRTYVNRCMEVGREKERAITSQVAMDKVSKMIVDATIMRHMRDYNGAIEQYNAALALDPANEKAKAGLLATHTAIEAEAKAKSEYPKQLAAMEAKAAASGQWIDPKTGSTWALKDNGVDASWQQARDYCTSLRIGDSANWDLPRIDQLQGLTSPADASSIFPRPAYHIAGEIVLSAASVWSSTWDGRKYLARRFDSGKDEGFAPGAKTGLRALCVR